MAGTQRLLATVLAFSLLTIPATGKPEPLGMVVQAERAKLGPTDAAKGSTIFDGDEVSTGETGSMQVRIGEATLYLAGASGVIIRKAESARAEAVAAELVRGATALSTGMGVPGEILAAGAQIYPVGKERGLVRVRLAGTHELIVLAERGPAEISYHGEEETIAEGKCYRVKLNAEEEKAAGEEARPPSKRPRKLVLVAVVASVAVAAMLWRFVGRGTQAGNVESPDRL